MLARYDEDPVASLTAALRIVLDRPDDTWPELVARSAFSETRAAALLVGDPRSLDDLAAELNEQRELR